MNYGMPYKGSKNRIAEKIVSQLPQATHFYDLFGGGGAIAHYALLSGKFQYVHYNELDPLVFKGFKMFINGDFKNENRWISREDFNRLKDSDPYVAICFSFGNDARTYLYASERTKFKKAVHYSICFKDNSLLWEYGLEVEYHSEDLKERRLEMQRYFSELYKQGKLNPKILKYFIYSDFNIRNVSQNLLNLERLNSFASDSSNIILTNQSYSDVQIEPDSVIYCDPPYLGTEQYRTGFDPEKFYGWLRDNPNRVYISEYQMPPDFTEVFAVQKQCRLNDKGSKQTVEKLFTNKPLENPLEF
jgi:site-specific DNA-adenine methylase